MKKFILIALICALKTGYSQGNSEYYRNEYFSLEIGGSYILHNNIFNDFIRAYNQQRKWLDQSLTPIYFLPGFEIGSGIIRQEKWMLEGSFFLYRTQREAKGASPTIPINDTRTFALVNVGFGLDCFYTKKPHAHFLFGGAAQIQSWGFNSKNTYGNADNFNEGNFGIGPKLQYVTHFTRGYFAIELGCLVSILPVKMKDMKESFGMNNQKIYLPMNCFAKLNLRI